MILMMMGRDMRAMWPGELLFWFVMSLGVTVGFIIAYPVNVLLVAKNMKHGLMTVRVETGNHSSAHHAGHGAAHSAKPKSVNAAESVTRPQIVTLTAVTFLALIAGMFVPAAFVNLGRTLGASHDWKK